MLLDSGARVTSKLQPGPSQRKRMLVVKGEEFDGKHTGGLLVRAMRH